jgi:hypothetical protein
MLGRLQSSLLQRYSLQCLEYRFHTACSLTQAAADGPPVDSNPQQKSRQASGGGPNRQRKNPARDGPGSDRGLQRPNYSPRGSDGGPNRGGGSYRQQQQRGGGGGGGGGQRNTNYQGGPRRPHQGGGGGGNQNILEAALGPQQSGPPKTGAEAIMQVCILKFSALFNFVVSRLIFRLIHRVFLLKLSFAVSYTNSNQY